MVQDRRAIGTVSPEPLPGAPGRGGASPSAMDGGGRRHGDPGGLDLSRRVEPMTLHFPLQDWALSRPEAPAVAAPGRDPLTYAALWRQIGLNARVLTGLGVCRQNCVAIALPPGPELAVAILTVAAVAAAAPINPTVTGADLQHSFDALAPVALIVPAGDAGQVRQAALDRAMTIIEVAVPADAPAGLFTFVGCAAGSGDETTFSGPEDTALILSTSATTARAKFVPLTHENVRAATDNTGGALGLGSGDRCLVASNLYHAHGLVAGMLSSLVAGGVAICPPAFDPEAFFSWLDAFRPTWFTAVPTMHQALLREAPRHREVVARQRLRFIRSASAYLPDAVRAELEATFATIVVEGYGLTEAMQLTNTPLDPGTRKIGSLGVTGTATIAIISEGGSLLEPGASGEIVARGAVVMSGYLHQPEATAAAFHNGWFRTGDVGYLDADGHLYMTGRLKDQINRGGEKISPQEVDQVLLSHPAVSQALAFGMAHPTLGEDVAAAVIPRPGVAVTAEELRQYCRDRLQEFKVPRKVFLVDILPANPTGKLLRSALAAQLGVLDDRPDHVPPRNALERSLAAIWEELLGCSGPGIHDDFFDLGGQSLVAAQAVSRIRRDLHIDIPVRTLFEHPTIAALGEVLPGQETQVPPLVRVPREGHLRLSFAQQRLWLLEQLEPGSTAYSMPEAYRLVGSLDIGALQRTVDALVQRHESLRTSFATVEGEPVQVIAATAELRVSVEEAGPGADDRKEEAARAWTQRQAAIPFDLAVAPLFRVHVLRLGPEEHVLFLNMHHIVSDGWSKVILARELSALYAGFSSGRDAALEEPPWQYVDYAYWQRDYLQGTLLESQTGYWQKQLQGAPALLNLPIDHARPAVMQPEGRRVTFQLDETLARQLHQLCRSHRVTLFQLLLAAFHVFLGRCCRQDDIVTGSPIAGRQRVEFEPLVGFFVNTLALRSHIRPDESFQAVLARVRETTLAAYQHQDVPFERLVEELNPQRSRAFSPLFQVMYIFQNNAPRALDLAALAVTPFPAGNAATKFDLTLSLEEREGTISGFLEYRRDLFEVTTIERMAANFQVLVAGIAADPDAPVGTLPLVAESERHQLDAWNETAMAWPQDRCVHQLFEEQAGRMPEAIAVVCEEQTLTYRQLDARANHLAHRLRQQGVGPESLVGLFCERGLDMVVGLLGILKAGGAYVALDPVLPRARLLYLLEDGQVEVLVTQSDLRAALPAMETAVICVDGNEEPDPPTAASPAVEVRPENLAYVLYTSGSTGKPKGVCIEHRQLVHYIFGLRERLGLEAGVSYATVSTLSADLGNSAVFPALTLGGCLHVISQDRILSGELMAEYFLRHRIDFLKITPSHLAALHNVAEPARIMPRRWLVVGGEASRLPWIDQVAGLCPDCAVYNHYGPSETTIGVLTFRVKPERPETPTGTLVLGRPLPNQRMHIVDSGLRPVPIGVSGELLIGGAGVGRGYLRREELTAERFIPDPSGTGRLYRSGDLVRYLADGTIEFLGRIDDQIKIRGYRVETGEVESVLGQHPAVTACAVLPFKDNAGEMRLVAYVAGAEVTTDELRQHVRQALPEFMVPSLFVHLDTLPITANGKLDRQALPPEMRTGAVEKVRTPPRNEFERRLVDIWQRVLGVAEIGIDDDFFEMGGHSLLSVRLFAMMSRELGEFLPGPGGGDAGTGPALRPSLLWTASTIRQLAPHIAGVDAAAPPELTLIEVQRGEADRLPLLVLTGDWGGMGFYVRKIAGSLDPGQPVFALMPHDITVAGSPRTIEAMAEAFLPEVCRVQPAGPYRLGGYSHAGLVALEIARRLQDQGERVSLLFIIDTTMPDPRLRFLRRWIRLLARLRGWDPEQEKASFLSWRYRVYHALALWQEGVGTMAGYYLRRFFPHRSLDREPERDPEPWLDDRMTQLYIQAVRLYVPEKYRGTVTVISSKAGPASRSGDVALGWRRVADTVEVARVPGNHVTCLTLHADKVAQVLEGRLEAPDVVRNTGAA